MPQFPLALGERKSGILFGLLVFLSGMAALGHQLLWTRRLVDLLGASAESSARVFGTFFLGLSIGSAVAALLVGRTKNPLRLAGLVQLCIPLLVLPVIFLSELTEWIWPLIGSQSSLGNSEGVIKSLLTLGFVFPPSALMGLSFPLIVAGVLRLGSGGLGRSGITLYAINTLGGACGVLLTVMVALPQLGNFASMLLAGAIDGAVGVALLFVARASANVTDGQEKTLRSESKDKEAAPTPNPLSQQIGLAFFSGMAVLSLEVAAFQMFQLVATISLFSPAAVLFCAITSLGTSAAIFARFESTFVSKSKERTTVLILVACGILVVLAPQIFMGIAERSNWFADNGGATQFFIKLGLLALLSIGPAWLVSGLIFPLAVAVAGRDCSPKQAGQRLGLLLAVNGLGGLLGAELTYRVLLPRLGVYGALAAIGLGFVLAAITISLFSKPSQSRYGSRVLASMSAMVVLTMGLINSFLPVVNPPPGIEAIDIQSGREGTVAVMETRDGGRSILVDNQYVLGGTAVRFDQERQVLLPIVLHKNPSSVGCIGLATGITPGAALAIPSVNEVKAIEISASVARAAERYFQDFNHDIFSNQSASVVIGDGRTYFASLPDRFDVITGDLFLPWSPGTSRLYSIEHFSSVREALKSDGIFCQWLPMYQLTPEHFRRIAETFASVFPETHLFMNHFRVGAPMVALVGSKRSEWLDWNRVRNRCDQFRESNSISDPLLRHRSGVGLLYLGQWKSQQNQSRLVSLSDPSLEYSAATVRLSPDPGKKYFNAANWIRFCRSRAKESAKEPNQDFPEKSELMTLATGLLELDYAKQNKHKLTDSIARRVSQSLPSCFADDDRSDRQRWPGPKIVPRFSDSEQSDALDKRLNVSKKYNHSNDIPKDN
ncbi:Spermidine synthase [Rubripirellula obstinata]|uniref:Spermidine synthase n=1 Tax=Rubripirellula obstinata TaxID=406547 RepID=A0A5B1CLL5_9BACT|nr:hypothetical protein [Rubripirellula obstinata]KAA1261222.1 Spermidine synthase [Rubripirellula obstinata]